MFQEFKKIFKHFFVYGFGSVANKTVSIILIPLYTRFLDPAEYGKLELISMTSTIISTFLAMGISSAALRFYFEYEKKKDRQQIIGSALAVSVIVSLCSAVILSYFSGFFSNLLFDSIDYSQLFVIIFFTMFLSITEEIPLAYIRAREYSLVFVAVSFFKLAATLALNIFFVVVLKKGIWGILVGNLIVSAVTWIFLTSLTVNFSRLNFSFSKLKEMVRYGMPLIWASFGMFILNGSDRFFLKEFSDLYTVGLYSLGYKVSLALSFLIIQPFMSHYSPYRFSIMKKPDAKEIYSRVLTYFLFVIIFAGIIISVLIKEVLSFLVAPSFLDSYKIVFPVIVSYIFQGAYFICQIGIYLQKRTKHMSRILLVCAVFNLALNWLLIPRFNMFGAAYATLLSFALLALITNLYSQKLYPIKYEKKRIMKLATAALGVYALSLFVSFESVALTVVLKSLLLIAFPLILHAVKFFMPEEIKKLGELKQMIFSRAAFQKEI